MARFHRPVLLQRVIGYLGVEKGEKYIDATVGGAGHSEAILKLGGKLLAIDCDPEAIKAAKEYLSTACPVPTSCRDLDTSWRLARGNFSDLAKIARRHRFAGVSGILFDLGVSSHQLEKTQRGFSFNRDAPLDMRMDPALKVTAADLVSGLNKGELTKLFAKFIQRYDSQRVAKAIGFARRQKPIQTTWQLTEVIRQALPEKKGLVKIHPATRFFMALRIAVNTELNNLQKALPQALRLLKPTGKLAVISFHSGEDRLVKHFLGQKEKEGRLKVLTKKPVRPSKQEIERNPRSRSAKLRVGEKC